MSIKIVGDIPLSVWVAVLAGVFTVFSVILGKFIEVNAQNVRFNKETIKDNQKSIELSDAKQLENLLEERKFLLQAQTNFRLEISNELKDVREEMKLLTSDNRGLREDNRVLRNKVEALDTHIATLTLKNTELSMHIKTLVDMLVSKMTATDEDIEDFKNIVKKFTTND